MGSNPLPESGVINGDDKSSQVRQLFFTNSFMFNLKGIVKRSSSCVDRILVDVVAGTCTVVYNNGTVYDYTNVSRRALFSLLNNESVSLGFFINTHLLYAYSKCAQYGECKQWIIAGAN